MLYWGIVLIFPGENRTMPIYEYECDQCGESFEKMVPALHEKNEEKRAKSKRR